MKTLFALTILALSLSAQAVDITVSVTAGELSRAQVELGKAKNYRTPDIPGDPLAKPPTLTVLGVPRDATASEVKQYLADTLRILVLSGETSTKQKIALDTIVPPVPIDPK